MRNLFKGIFILICSISCSTILYAGIPNSTNGTTFLGPTLSGRFTTLLNEYTAVSALAEAGRKNLRVGGSAAYKIENQRIKLSLEYLSQDISYPFFSGNSTQWMHQGAIGGAYAYDFVGCFFNPSFDLAAYYSRAPSRNLTARFGFFENSCGDIFQFVNLRRIAGSNAYGIAPGIGLEPWCNGRVGAILNYDKVRYDTVYDTSDSSLGWGGTLYLSQWINDVNVGLAASWRKPFNNYSARVAWANLPCFENFAVGVQGDYTVGKNHLPNTYNVSLTFDYFLVPCPCPSPSALRQRYSLKGELVDPPSSAPSDIRFMNWASTPAVYHPQVLAIPDELIEVTAIPPPPTPPCPPPTPPCPPPPVCPDGTPPVVIATLPNLPISGNASVPAATAFSGTNLTFSVAAPGSAPNVVTINPVTGGITIVTAPGSNVFFPVTVTATNRCGSATTAFAVSVNTVPPPPGMRSSSNFLSIS